MSSASLVRRVLVEPLKRLAGAHRWRPWRRRYLALRHRNADRAQNRQWCVSSPRILVVSEPGHRPAYWHFLDWLARERPEIRRQIYLGRLPCRMPHGTSLLHAWVQDPVAERAPHVHAMLVELEAECARRGGRVVHPSKVLSNTARDVLFERLAQANLLTPRVVRVDADFHARRDHLRLPMLVRRRWGHGPWGGLRRLDTEASFESWWAHARTDTAGWVASEYVDVRSPDGWYRKYRYFMAGSRGNARHLIVSPNWEVRPSDRVRTQATREEELAFVTAPFPHHALFDAARVALGFEIAAFDYSYDASGGVVVWEVNPYPDLSRPKGEVGAYLEATVEKSYAILADFYAERIEP
jgi:hypothetical protein